MCMLQVDSDTEEPVIFHQHLKSLGTEEDKDLDTSQHTHTDNSALTSSLPDTKDNADEGRTQLLVSATISAIEIRRHWLL